MNSITNLHFHYNALEVYMHVPSPACYAWNIAAMSSYFYLQNDHNCRGVLVAIFMSFLFSEDQALFSVCQIPQNIF